MCSCTQYGTEQATSQAGRLRIIQSSKMTHYVVIHPAVHTVTRQSGRRASPNISTRRARRCGRASGDRLEAPSDQRHRDRRLTAQPIVNRPPFTVIQTVTAALHPANRWFTVGRPRRTPHRPSSRRGDDDEAVSLAVGSIPCRPSTDHRHRKSLTIRRPIWPRSTCQRPDRLTADAALTALPSLADDPWSVG
jgi:hypothetical protein